MAGKSIRRGCAALLALVALPVFAGERDEAADHALLPQVQALAAGGQPLELLAASMLASSLEGAEASGLAADWLDQAIRGGSEHPVIARAAVRRCVAGGDCDIPEAVRTLQTREADEALAQLLLWRMAHKQGDADAAAQAWRRAMQAGRMADVVAEGVALLDHATGDMHWPATPGASKGLGLLPGPAGEAEATRLVILFAVVAAQAMPELADIMRECPEDAAGERRQQCRHLFTLMADSNALVMADIGTSRMRAFSDGAAERQAWDARQRELRWVMEQAMPLLSSANPQATIREYLQWMHEGGERLAMQRLLAAHGVAAQPPADGKSGGG